MKRSRDGQWYWKLVAANGEPLATSETYTRRADAVRGAWRFTNLAFAAHLIRDDA